MHVGSHVVKEVPHAYNLARSLDQTNKDIDGASPDSKGSVALGQKPLLGR